MSNAHENIDYFLGISDKQIHESWNHLLDMGLNPNYYKGYNEWKRERKTQEGDVFRNISKEEKAHMVKNKLLQFISDKSYQQFGDENVNVGFNPIQALQGMPSFNIGANLGQGVSANLGLMPRQDPSLGIRADLGNNLMIEGLLNQYMPELSQQVPQKYGIKISKGF